MLPPNNFQPREYQLKIAKSALESNTLVVLPTGLGKTVIAALVAKARLESFQNGKILVLAPTRPLVLQHSATFKDLLPLPANHFSVLTGEIHPDERVSLWRSSKFIFATPQTVRNDLKSERMQLEDFVFAVFDEAHRCVRDYSYTEVAKLYMEQAKNPLILGLTASPGSSRDRIREIKRNLFIQRVEARSEDDTDVMPYIEKTKLEGIKVKLPEEFNRLILALREIHGEKIRRLIDAGFLPKGRFSKKILLQSRAAMVARLKSSENSGKERGYVFGSLINQAQAVMILHAIELVETQGIAVLSKYLSRLREKPEHGKATIGLLNDRRWLFVEEETNRLLHFEHPKLQRLVSIIKEQLTAKSDSKIIVFTQYRDTIDSILSKLSSLDLNAQRFVGQSDKMNNEGMDQRTQSHVLEKFKSSQFNILVSSSIGEEGLHVPDVDLVIFYEAVPSEIRSIQRKGRTGRTRPGRVVILLAEETIDETYYYSSISRERLMKKLVSEEPIIFRHKSKTRNPTLLDYID